MKVEPEFSVKVDDVTFTTGSLSYPQPVVDSRKATTTLLVDSGQTVVMGGLRKKEVQKVVNKIPLLGDIPIICWAFRFEGEQTVNSEMIVFVTPKLVMENAMTEHERKQYQETEFPGPAVQQTRAEKDIAEGKNQTW
jgi:type II secretory pathway component GspD/PulD (secretin)